MAKPGTGKRGRIEAALATHQRVPGCAALLGALTILIGAPGAATSGVAFW